MSNFKTRVREELKEGWVYALLHVLGGLAMISFILGLIMGSLVVTGIAGGALIILSIIGYHIMDMIWAGVIAKEDILRTYMNHVVYLRDKLDFIRQKKENLIVKVQDLGLPEDVRESLMIDIWDIDWPYESTGVTEPVNNSYGPDSDY